MLEGARSRMGQCEQRSRSSRSLANGGPRRMGFSASQELDHSGMAG